MTVRTSSKRNAGFAGFFGGFSQSLQDYRMIRQTRKELSNLSDRELADLNIARWDIERVSRQAVKSR